jgi:hypothetical protein
MKDAILGRKAASGDHVSQVAVLNCASRPREDRAARIDRTTDKVPRFLGSVCQCLAGFIWRKETGVLYWWPVLVSFCRLCFFFVAALGP